MIALSQGTPFNTSMNESTITPLQVLCIEPVNPLVKTFICASLLTLFEMFNVHYNNTLCFLLQLTKLQQMEKLNMIRVVECISKSRHWPWTRIKSGSSHWCMDLLWALGTSQLTRDRTVPGTHIPTWVKVSKTYLV